MSRVDNACESFCLCLPRSYGAANEHTLPLRTITEQPAVRRGVVCQRPRARGGVGRSLLTDDFDTRTDGVRTYHVRQLLCRGSAPT